MSPPLLGIEEHNVPLMASSASEDCISPSGLKEHNYLGLSDCSSVDSSTVSSAKTNLNLKATELRLGLPGSQSPEHEDSGYSPLVPSKLDEKPLFPLGPSKDGICPLSSRSTFVSGNKRGFSDTEPKNTLFGEAKWISGQPNLTGTLSSVKTTEVSAKASNERRKDTMNGCKNNSVQPAAKAQVVGWPPVRPFRKSALAMAASSKNNDEVDGKAGPAALLVKVSMDGAPYLRKVDLRMYSSYQELSSSLEKMFSCFTIGQCGPKGTPSREMMNETKPRDLLHGPEYVLTYEDKDGDWMLVGDVPWDMFIASCKRLKIMKGSDAIGLAPRAMEKSKNPN